jgi:hypothetical protein
MKYPTLLIAAFLAAVIAPVIVLAQQDAEAPAAAEPATSSSEATAQAEPDPVSLFQKLVRRARSGEWLPALAAVLMLLTWAARRFGAKIAKRLGSKWFDTKTGGYVTSLLTTLVITVAAPLHAGEPFSWGLLTAGLGAAWAASGAYDGLRDALSGKK